MRRTTRAGAASTGAGVGRRRLAGLLAAVVAVTATAFLAPPPAAAIHAEKCDGPYPYTSMDTVRDESIAEGIVIGLELVQTILSAAADAVEQAAEKAEDAAVANPEPVSSKAMFTAAHTLERSTLIMRIAVMIADGTVAAGKVAHLALVTQNKLADICRTDRHWQLEDELLASAIRRDLAATTTPVALFVLPEANGGFIDVEKFGVRDLVTATIDRMVELKQCTCTSAKSYLSQGNSHLAAGSYKKAYTAYRQAYVLAFSN
ncbi:MAG TPA: hypothetical protein VM242_00870 [Acidimicrobiales bacterium]|jgi:hypothetical protein|nr:hypothetical protein [Acidimicrobiales bacterium]